MSCISPILSLTHQSSRYLQAKSRIHAMMSRQLEALRTREVWLLDQVELLHDTKDSLLLQQAHSLRQALGALTSCRQYLESGEPADMEAIVRDTIRK
jgi:nuclear receptor coactivator 4